jgi:hypothetical protein
MATCHFTRLCALLRAFLRRFFLKAAYSYTSSQVIALKAVGQHINVTAFPDYHGLGMTDPAGLYFVDSVVFHHTGQIELGLLNNEQDHVGYYDFDDLVISE